MTADVMVQCAAFTKRNPDEVALCFFGRLADRFRNFAGLALAEAGAALLVTDHHESCKTEVLAALHSFRDAVDANQLVDEFRGLIVTFARGLAIAAAASFLSSFFNHQPNSFRI